MVEINYTGHHLFVNFINGKGEEEVYGGILEGIVLAEDNSYKVTFSEMYQIGFDGKYQLIKGELPFLRSIPYTLFKGIDPEGEEGVKEYYRKCNESIEMVQQQIKKEQEKTLKDQIRDVYKSEGNDHNNFYSHKPKIGFKTE